MENARREFAEGPLSAVTADARRPPSLVRSAPKAGIRGTAMEPPGSTRSGHSSVLLDHLIGAYEQRLRHSEIECLRSLEVDHQVVFRLLLHRQIGRFGAFENLSGVSAEQAPSRSKARPIADQAAGIDGLAPRIDRRNGMA